MYLKKLHLKNIKCFEDVTLEFPHRGDDYSGWIVLLGENGTGKTSILRGIASCELETFDTAWSMYDDDWVSQNAEKGQIRAAFLATPFDSPSDRGAGGTRFPTLGEAKKLTLKGFIHRSEHLAPKNDTSRNGRPNNGQGWMSTGYGPFRRFSFQPAESTTMQARRYGTLFDSSIGIVEPFTWLPTLYSYSIDKEHPERKRSENELAALIKITNALLPKPVQISKIYSEKVLFSCGHSAIVPTHGLSDGYCSYLAIVVDLLKKVFSAVRRIDDCLAVGSDGVPRITLDGIVLIDEADAHLHPRWQRELSTLLCRVFPKIQFIVTTHSPFVAQEATKDGLFVLTTAKNGAVEVSQPIDSVQGWTASQILTSPLFGLDSLRDPDTEALVSRYEELREQKQTNGRNGKHKAELAKLEQQLRERLSAPGDSFEDMQRQQAIRQYLDAKIKKPGAKR